MNAFHLFAGVGGGILGSLLLGHQIIGANEIDGYCCDRLRQRQIDGCLPGFPIWQMDIREFNDRVAPSYEGMVDVLCAGFPCQPFSQNGKQSGEQDERNQWPGTIAAIRIIQPQFVFLENVPGLQNFYYYSKILSELRGEGFTLQSGELAACDIGAPVEKRRLFILASPNSINGEPRMGFIEDRPKPLQQRDSESLSEYWIQAADRASGGNCWDSRYVDRGKAVGNIQVPIVAAIAEAILMRNIG